MFFQCSNPTLSYGKKRTISLVQQRHPPPKNWRAQYQPCETPLSRIFWECKVFRYNISSLLDPALYEVVGIHSCIQNMFLENCLKELLWSWLVSPAVYYQFLSTLNWEDTVELFVGSLVVLSIYPPGCQSQMKVRVVVPYYKCNNPSDAILSYRVFWYGPWKRIWFWCGLLFLLFVSTNPICYPTTSMYVLLAYIYHTKSTIHVTKTHQFHGIFVDFSNKSPLTATFVRQNSSDHFVSSQGHLSSIA